LCEGKQKTYFLSLIPSSIIGKVRENAMECCGDKEDHSGTPVHPEWYLDPSKSCAELEQDQDHVDQPQDQDDRNSADLHI
jgi:hypothetical protein